MRFKFWSGSLLVLGLFAVLCVVSCGGGFQSYTPPTPCSPALACVQAPSLYQNTICPLSNGKNLMFRTGNLHPTLGVWATFQVEIVALNQPGNPTTTEFQSFPLNVHSAPDLGCQYQLTGGDYEYFYQPVSACFMGTLDCTGQSAIARRPSVGDCFQSTDYCMEFDLSGLPSGPDQQVARQATASILNLVNQKPPIVINISKLLLPGSCQRNDAIVSATNEFEDLGLQCSASILVQNKTAKALRITIPTIFSGSFAQLPGTSASISPHDASKSPILEWFDQNDKSMGIEHIARVDFVTTSAGKPQVRILGDTHFCISITFPKP